MQSFYRDYYKKYIQALQSAADKADRWARFQTWIIRMFGWLNHKHLHFLTY